MTPLGIYWLGMNATALVTLVEDRTLGAVLVSSLLWPLWVLATVQECLECL